jgi:D-alanyl-D-alanine carboxypeptidase
MLPSGKPMRPDVAAAIDRMAAAARGEAGLSLSISSGFRSEAEQAVPWNAKPKPYLVLLSRAPGPSALKSRGQRQLLASRTTRLVAMRESSRAGVVAGS